MEVQIIHEINNGTTGGKQQLVTEHEAEDVETYYYYSRVLPRYTYVILVRYSYLCAIWKSVLL